MSELVEYMNNLKNRVDSIGLEVPEEDRVREISYDIILDRIAHFFDKELDGRQIKYITAEQAEKIKENIENETQRLEVDELDWVRRVQAKKTEETHEIIKQFNECIQILNNVKHFNIREVHIENSVLYRNHIFKDRKFLQYDAYESDINGFILCNGRGRQILNGESGKRVDASAYQEKVCSTLAGNVKELLDDVDAAYKNDLLELKADMQTRIDEINRLNSVDDFRDAMIKKDEKNNTEKPETLESEALKNSLISEDSVGTGVNVDTPIQSQKKRRSDMNFKSLREDKLKLSKEQFADIYGVSVDEVNQYDEQPEKIDLELIQKIISKTGLTLEEIISFEKPKIKQFQAKDTWHNVDFTKKGLMDYIQNSLADMNIPEDESKKYIDDFKIGIEANLIKPSIAIVGRSDTGKSTLINSLIGMEKMPTSWTPTTSIAVYIKHINERPSFITDNAWVFADEKDGEKVWNVKRLYDEEYCKSWKIASGDVDVLKNYGTRQGGGLKTNAGSAVVFIDAPILQNCDIVDLPGFGTEKESDDNRAFQAAQRSDILIYLSQANGFMRIEDITYLKNNVKNLPVWEKTMRTN